jgi:hypothetical protein
MQDPNAFQASQSCAEAPSEQPPKNSWIRGITRPAADIEIDDVDNSACRDDQCVQIACLALAAG